MNKPKHIGLVCDACANFRIIHTDKLNLADYTVLHRDGRVICPVCKQSCEE